MAIDYRSVNPTDVEDAAKRQRAAEAEVAAFAAEVEVERLDAVAKSTRKKADKEAVLAAKEEARANAETKRARAKAAKEESALTSDEEVAVQRNFLNRWIDSLEKEHVGHTILVSQNTAALAVTGSGELTETERADTERAIANSEEALKVIESSWHVATEKLDALPSDEVDDEEA
jgi:hypothetical protein